MCGPLSHVPTPTGTVATVVAGNVLVCGVTSCTPVQEALVLVGMAVTVVVGNGKYVVTLDATAPATLPAVAVILDAVAIGASVKLTVM